MVVGFAPTVMKVGFAPTLPAANKAEKQKKAARRDEVTRSNLTTASPIIVLRQG